MLTQQEIEQFVTAISSLNWNTNFIKFCEILGFNPEHQYAKDKWQQFQELNKSLNYFDITSLAKMVAAYHNQKQAA